MQTIGEKIMEAVGGIITVLGMCSADSECLLVPFTLILIGLPLFYFGARAYEDYEYEEDDYDD